MIFPMLRTRKRGKGEKENESVCVRMIGNERKTERRIEKKDEYHDALFVGA